MRMARWCLVVAVVVAGSLHSVRAAEEAAHEGKTTAEWAKLLSDKDDTTRTEAMAAVLALGEETDWKKLSASITPLLKDSTPLVRARAAHWLARVVHDQASIEVAKRLLDHDSYAVRREAIIAIGFMGPDAKNCAPLLRDRIAYLGRAHEVKVMEPGETAETVLLWQALYKVARPSRDRPRQECRSATG